MHQVLKLRLQGLSPYRIARELNQDPPKVYKSLKAAKQNFAELDHMLTELKALGWPEKLAEIETGQRLEKKRIVMRPQSSETRTEAEEIPIKFM